MQQTSELWKSLFASGANRGVRFTINGVKYGGDKIVSARIIRSGMDRLAIGNAVAASLELSFFPAGDIPRMAEITCEVRMQQSATDIFVGGEDEEYDEPFMIETADGYIIAAQYSDKSEWITRGKFYIDTRKLDKTTGVLTVTAYDCMLKAEADYIDQNGTYPMPMSDAVAYIASQIGVEVDERNEIYGGKIDSPTHVYNMREVLRFIAAASGGNFIISDTGKLRLVKVAAAAENATEYDCAECFAGDAVTITGVRLLPDDEKEYFVGTKDGYVIEGECAYATEKMCNTLLDSLSGVVYRPVDAWDALLDPALEIGDSVALGGVTSVLWEDDVTFGAAMLSNASAPFEEEVEHEFHFQSRTREQRMTADSFSRITKTTDAITQEVQGKIGEAAAQSLIATTLNGIEISSSTTGVTDANSASITLSGKSGDVNISATGKITMGNVQASSISASNITAGTLNASAIAVDGAMALQNGAASVGTFGVKVGLNNKSFILVQNNSGSEIVLDSSYAALRGGWISLFSTDCNQGAYITKETLSNGQKLNTFVCSNYGLALGTPENRWETVYCSAVNDSSDRALKKDIAYGLGKYDKLFDALRPCSYRFIREGENGKINTGFVAQDVDAAVSAAGLARDDFAGLAMSEKEGASGLVYNQFIALLVDQVQTLKARVAALEKAAGIN